MTLLKTLLLNSAAFIYINKKWLHYILYNFKSQVKIVINIINYDYKVIF